MKNITTPRTLADASFTTGYSRAEIRRTGRAADLVILVLAIGFVGALIFGGFNA